MWYIESMPDPYRTEWERHKPGFKYIEEALLFSSDLLRNYSLERLAIRLVRVDQE